MSLLAALALSTPLFPPRGQTTIMPAPQSRARGAPPKRSRWRSSARGFAEGRPGLPRVTRRPGTAYRDVAQARACIGSFIETVYNRQRLHSVPRRIRGLSRSSPILLVARCGSIAEPQMPSVRS